MAVKMRLMRMGKTKSPYYRVVVMDGRAPRDGRYIDMIGRYDPRQEPSVIEIDTDKAVDWLRKGAQPTEAVSKILDAAGALTQFKVKAGQIHTVGGPRTTTPESTTTTAPEAEEEAIAADAPAEPSNEVEAEALDTTDEAAPTDVEEE